MSKNNPAGRQIKQIIAIHRQHPEIKQGSDLVSSVDQQIARKEIAVNEAIITAIWLVEQRIQLLHFSGEVGHVTAQIRRHLRQLVGEVAGQKTDANRRSCARSGDSGSSSL